LGSNSRTLTVTDLSGNTGTCVATITVVDGIAPAITCPANITTNNGSGQCSATVTYSTPAGTDNCTPTTAQTAGLASGATFPVGTTTNTFRVTDGSGNSTTCSFTVTVTDVDAPTITCPANINANNDAGQCSAAVTYSAPNGTDNCTGATTTQIAGNASGATFALGTTTNTFQVADAAGNTASCSFDVTVADAEAPTFSNCPSSATGTTGVTCDGPVTWTAPTASDNCSVSSTTSTANPGDTFQLGNTTVTYTTTDAAGNTGTCSFTVTVTDATAPTALCLNFAVTLNLSGNASIAATDIDGGSSDNCSSVTSSVTPTTFTCANVGANTVTLTVTDAAGNTSTCTSTVTVSAQAMTAAASSPTINCGYNVSCNGATDGTATVTAGGGCPGYTYLWDNGNTTATATGLGAGVHSVTVTDINGGTIVTDVTLTEPSPISITSTSTNSCVGGSSGTVDITANGGNDCSAYTFSWSNGATTEDLSGVPAGTYFVTVTDVNGCVGVDTVVVDTFASPAPTFTVAGNTLTSVQTWTTYQWLLNGSPISGATSSTYTATVTGDYSLQITDGNGCTGISGMTNVIVVAVEDPTQDLLGLSIYPNPARGEFKLLAAQPIHQGLTVTIYDMHGHRFVEKAMPSLGNEVAFDIQNYSAGAYMVEVVTKSGHRKTFKLVVQ
ncbi:MAG: HYR domain-containing protein, partial [Bacteroidia bacterium]